MKHILCCVYGVWLVAGLMLGRVAHSAEPNLNDLPSDLIVPAVTHDAPAAGKRVWQKLPGDENKKVAYALYLPTDWEAGKQYPVLFEYPGNGNYRNALGDRSDGRVEDCQMGFGLTAGKGAIWVSLPFVNPQTGEHSISWWGDADATASYCKQVVKIICQKFGGDSRRLVLAGFSRGAIAGNYIGLRDDEIAKLWCGFVLHSHYDGVRRWGYAGDDPESAQKRLKRLGNRPQFISHEQQTTETENYLRQTGFQGEFTFASLPFPNHSSGWLLKKTALRDDARNWLEKVLQK